MSAPVVAVLHNLERCFTGHAGAALLAAGVELDERRLRAGDPLPELGEVDGIVSFGGEQTALDPGLAEQARLLARGDAGRRPGARGLPRRAAARPRARRRASCVLERRMVRWAPLEPLPAAEGDPLLGALPAGAAGLHWNEDGFSLPPGATELLRSPAGTVEGFRAGERSWGIQFHPELDDAALEGWYEDWYAALAQAGVSEDAARAADREHMPGQGPLSEAIFGGFARIVHEFAVSLPRHA